MMNATQHDAGLPLRLDLSTQPPNPDEHESRRITPELYRILVGFGEELADLREMLSVNREQTDERKWLTPTEFSERLKKRGVIHRQMKPDTVCGNCGRQRLRCIKKGQRGKHKLWLLPIEEVERFINEGLLPPPDNYRHVS